MIPRAVPCGQKAQPRAIVIENLGLNETHCGIVDPRGCGCVGKCVRKRRPPVGVLAAGKVSPDRTRQTEMGGSQTSSCGGERFTRAS